MMIFCQTNTVTQFKILNQNANEILRSVPFALKSRRRHLVWKLSAQKNTAPQPAILVPENN